MGLFDKDVLTAGGDTTPSTTGTSTTPANDSCRDPGKGMPNYDPVVLDYFYGVGKITRSEYDRVKAGLLSIADLNLGIEDLSRLRCQGSVTGSDAGPVFLDKFTSDSSTISATATESTFDKFLTIPAGAKVGDVYEFDFTHRQTGRYSTDATQYKVRMDNTSGALLFDAGAMAVQSGADIHHKGLLIVTGVGVSGSYKVITDQPGLGSQGYYTGSWDTTVDHKLVATVTFSSNNAANSAVSKLGMLKRFRAAA